MHLLSYALPATLSLRSPLYGSDILDCFLEFCCFVVHSDRCHFTGWAAYCDDIQERQSDFLEAWVAGVPLPGSRTEAVSEVLPGSLP